MTLLPCPVGRGVMSNAPFSRTLHSRLQPPFWLPPFSPFFFIAKYKALLHSSKSQKRLTKLPSQYKNRVKQRATQDLVCILITTTTTPTFCWTNYSQSFLGRNNVSKIPRVACVWELKDFHLFIWLRGRGEIVGFASSLPTVWHGRVQMPYFI